MDKRESTIQRAGTDTQTAMNKVMRQTYTLLSLTLIFSAIMASVALYTGTGSVNIIVFFVVIIGLSFAIQALRNSPFGIVLTFAYTGFLGWTLGPILNFYIKNFSNGPQLIMMALGTTGIIFLVMSAIGANPKRDFSGWGRTLAIGIVVAIVASLINVFIFKMPALFMAISVIIALISAAYIAFQTNMIVRGGERNYVIATVTLYASLYNLFIIILSFMGMAGGNRN